MERNTIHTIKRRKVNLDLSHLAFELSSETDDGGGIEVTERQGRRRKQLLDYLKETRGCNKLKEEALGLTLWRTLF